MHQSAAPSVRNALPRRRAASRWSNFWSSYMSGKVSCSSGAAHQRKPRPERSSARYAPEGHDGVRGGEAAHRGLIEGAFANWQKNLQIPSQPDLSPKSG